MESRLDFPVGCTVGEEVQRPGGECVIDFTLPSPESLTEKRALELAKWFESFYTTKITNQGDPRGFGHVRENQTIDFIIPTNCDGSPLGGLPLSEICHRVDDRLKELVELEGE